MLYGDFAYDYPRNEVNDPIVRSSLALVTTRQTKADFAALVVDLPLAQHKIVTAYDGSYVSPLFTCTADIATQLVPNLAPRFLLALGKALDIEGESHHHLPTGVAPDDILAYHYAVLHAPSYRSRYAEFLKSDFPRIPIALDAAAPEGSTFAEVWTKLLPLGQEMIDLHLLRKVPSALRASFNVSGNSEVEKPRYEPPNTPMNPGLLGRVYTNATQCFEGVTPETWAFKVGGYQVCEKWLKDRKGRTLTSDDVDHYRNVVAALTRTQTLMQEIDAVANGMLWPK